jgi:hypothetical protein
VFGEDALTFTVHASKDGPERRDCSYQPGCRRRQGARARRAGKFILPIQLATSVRYRSAAPEYGKRRKHCPIVDFKLLVDVMEMLFDGAVGNTEPAPNFLV